VSSATAAVDGSVWGTAAAGIGGIEHELARLRRSRSAHSRELGVPVARASVLNLVVFATRESHARRAAAASRRAAWPTRSTTPSATSPS